MNFSLTAICGPDPEYDFSSQFDGSSLSVRKKSPSPSEDALIIGINGNPVNKTKRKSRMVFFEIFISLFLQGKSLDHLCYLFMTAR
jgi:hypothetical protein